MSVIRRLGLSKSNGIQIGLASTYVGGIDDIWADDVNFNLLRRGDGVTPGGIVMGGATTNLTYDSATKSVISEDVSSGGHANIVENFTNVSTPVSSVTLTSDMSLYTVGKITVDNGVDAPYVLSPSGYTYLNNVITFSPPTEDGQVAISEEENIYVPSYPLNTNETHTISYTPILGTVTMSYDSGTQTNYYTENQHWNISGTLITFTFGGGGGNYDIRYDRLGDQDGQVDIEVELISNSGYANLGTSTKAFKSLYVDNIHVTNKTLVTLSTLKSVVAASTDFADFQSRIAAL